MKKRKKVVLAKKNLSKFVKSNSPETESHDGINFFYLEHNEGARKLFKYLYFICKNIDTLNLSVEKEMIVKILKYLVELKIENPINFLKVNFYPYLEKQYRDFCEISSVKSG